MGRAAASGICRRPGSKGLSNDRQRVALPKEEIAHDLSKLVDRKFRFIALSFGIPPECETLKRLVPCAVPAKGPFRFAGRRRRRASSAARPLSASLGLLRAFLSRHLRKFLGDGLCNTHDIGRRREGLKP